MRGLILAAVVLAGPAWGQQRAPAQRPPPAAAAPNAAAQDFAVLHRHASELGMMFFIVGAAVECGARSAAWRQAIEGRFVGTQVDVAAAVPNAMAGGERAVSAYLDGTKDTSLLLGLAEARHRRTSLCPAVSSGVTLRYLDSLVAPTR